MQDHMDYPSSAPVFRLRVLSLNVWGVPVIGRHTRERIDAIVEHIAASEAYDVVCLQEAFLPDVWHRLAEQLGTLAGLRHHIRFVNGCDLPGQADGAGLAIFSRYPILDSAFSAFSACGRPHRVDQFDYQAGKGIGLARVLLPGDYGTADVYVSHFVAQYLDGPADDYAAQRVLQALDAAVFIRATRRSDITLLCTDLNAGPDTLVYRMLTTLAGLKDAYSCAHTTEEELADISAGRPNQQASSVRKRANGHGIDTSSSASHTSDSSSKEGGTLTDLRTEVAPSNAAPAVARSVYDATFGDADNFFTHNAMNNSAVVLRRVGAFVKAMGLSGQTATPSCDMNARLDYVLFGSGSSAWPFTPLPVALASSATRAWHVVASDIRMREPITLPNGSKINMSDHSGVFAEFACVLLRPAASLGMSRVLASPGGIPMSPVVGSGKPHTLSVALTGAGAREDQAALEDALRAAGVQLSRVAGLRSADEDEDGGHDAVQYSDLSSPGAFNSKKGGRASPPTPSGPLAEADLLSGGQRAGHEVGNATSTVITSSGSSVPQGPVDGSLLHAMSSYLRFLIVPWAEDDVARAAGDAGLHESYATAGQVMLGSPAGRPASSASASGSSVAPSSTLRLAQLHTSPFVAQALDAAAAALHVQMTRPLDAQPYGHTSAQAGTATAVSRGWRPVLREGLAMLERGRAQATALRDRQLKGAAANLIFAVLLLLGAAFADLQHLSLALGMIGGLMPAWTGRLVPAKLRALAADPHATLRLVLGSLWQPVDGAAQALNGGAAGACVLTLFVLGFMALMRVKNRTTLINLVVADVLVFGGLALWLLYQGGVRGCAVAGAEVTLCLAVVQTMAGLMTTPQEIRGFQRAQAQLRILLQRPPAVIA